MDFNTRMKLKNFLGESLNKVNLHEAQQEAKNWEIWCSMNENMVEEGEVVIIREEGVEKPLKLIHKSDGVFGDVIETKTVDTTDFSLIEMEVMEFLD